jgi:hypothetical protein
MTCVTCGAKSRLSKAREFTNYSLKGQGHKIFCFMFFHEPSFTKPKKITFGSFRTFSKIRADIRKSRCTAPMAYLPLVSRTPAANFATGNAGVVDIGGKVATGVNDTDSKFAAGVNNNGDKLPPVSFVATRVNDNGGK